MNPAGSKLALSSTVNIGNGGWGGGSETTRETEILGQQVGRGADAARETLGVKGRRVEF
jgi:hypothetical protein